MSLEWTKLMRRKMSPLWPVFVEKTFLRQKKFSGIKLINKNGNNRLSVYLFVRLFIHLFVCRSFYLCVCLFVRLFYHLFERLFVHLFVWKFVYLCICLFVRLFMHLFCAFVCPTIFLYFVCLSSVLLAVCQYVCFSREEHLKVLYSGKLSLTFKTITVCCRYLNKNFGLNYV